VNPPPTPARPVAPDADGWWVAVGAAWVVVDKPAGLPSVPGRTPDLADCAASRVQRVFPEARVVHRLDMATSGLLLFARGADAQRALSRAFEARQVHKVYDAVVHGCVPGDGGVVDLPLAADWPNRPRQQVDRAAGKASVTRYRVSAADSVASRLELEPLTGRSHQLRVHLAHIGHPIVGDRLYDPGRGDAAPRLMLHARELALADPVTGEPLRWTVPPPF
jgi:tRNA pseudouridine32 synthase/23S rRNA pseudouridine746 synthase